MTGNTIGLLFIAFALLILIPFLVMRDLKNGKKLVDIFTSNMLLFLLFLVSIGEVLRSFLSSDAMDYFNQTLFIFSIIFIVSPAIFILLYHFKNDIKKWSNPKEYKYYWVYKIRYLLFSILILVFIGALYRFYQIYKIVFA